MPVDPHDPKWTSTESFILMFRDVASALVAADPVGLTTAGAPHDEYDAEAAQIARLVLAKAQTRDDVLRIAGDVLAHYFGGHRYENQLGEFADAVWKRYLELRDDA